MSAPQDILEAVAEKLDQVAGLRAHSTTPGQVNPPAAVCEIERIVSPSAFGGSDFVVRVVLLVQKGDQHNSQRRTLALVDPVGDVSESVFAALLDYDPGGQVTFEGPGLVEYGGQQYAGGILTVEVYG